MITDDHDDRVPADPALAEAWFRGLLEGQRRMLERQIGHRYGSASRATLRRLASADLVALDRWARRVLVCATIEELFAKPPEPGSFEAWVEDDLRARREGRMTALRQVVLRTIRHRFGPPSPDVVAFVAKADELKLNLWIDRTFSAATLDEFLDGPAAPAATSGD